NQKYLAGASTGQYAAASKDRLKALAANPTATSKLQTSGEIKVAKDASDAFDEAVKLQTAQRYDEAIPLYQKAIQLVPKEPAYVYALGTVFQAKNDFDSAIVQYKKAGDMYLKNKQYKYIITAAYEAKAGR